VTDDVASASCPKTCSHTDKKHGTLGPYTCQEIDSVMGSDSGVCDYKGFSLTTFNGCDCKGCPCELDPSIKSAPQTAATATTTTAEGGGEFGPAQTPRDSSKPLAPATAEAAAPLKPLHESSAVVVASPGGGSSSNNAPVSLSSGGQLGDSGSGSSVMYAGAGDPLVNPMTQLFGILGAAASVFGGMDSDAVAQQQQQQQGPTSTPKAHHHHHSHSGN